MKDAERQRFDALLEEAIEHLPEHLHTLLEQVPLIVDDRPDRDLVEKLLKEADEPVTPKTIAELTAELCGLHSGLMITERSVEEPSDLPEDIRLFREGIINLAGGWDQDEADDILYEEIMITLLHEIGHHFGLDEGDLEELGFE